ncbi:hypothetical protein BS47DRAFT_771266 [Hydnum rufescens UP504]|uniref:Uncharacterized protein n=1 Tax=Hydnum rufescens UP504 TaxID=1448309 RepID=A0A9P6B0W8_9AGAM|nr:hypothetical protein BS47DRAFT_771266 [Hydnum rufescens UP504]
MQLSTVSDVPPTPHHDEFKVGAKLLLVKPLHKRHDVGRMESFSASDFIHFSTITGLDTIPVQRIARYQRIHWPFNHQFTVVTTVKIPPSALKTEIFSLQTTEGRRILLGDLDPLANGISFRIDRTSRVKLEHEDSEARASRGFRPSRNSIA